MTEDDWQVRVDAFWVEFDETDRDGCLRRMRALVDERAAGDPEALAALAEHLPRYQRAARAYAAELG